VGGTVVSLGVWFVVTPVLVHHLGSTQYGLWIIATAIVAYARVLDLGVGDAVTRHIAVYRAGTDEDRSSAVIIAALWIYSGLALVALALTALMVPLFTRIFDIPAADHGRAIAVLLLVGLNVACTLPAITSLAVLRGLHRFGYINIVSAASAVVMGTAIIIVVHAGGDVVAVAALGPPFELLAQIPMVLLIHRAAPDLRLRMRHPTRADTRLVLSFGAPQAIVRLAQQVRMQSDELFVGALQSTAQVTKYALTKRLTAVPVVLSDQFVDTLLPLSAELHATDDRARLQHLVIAGTRLATASCLLTGVSVALLAGPFLRAWVGPAYADVGAIAFALVLSRVFETAARPTESALIAGGTLRAPGTAAVISATLKIAAAIALGIAFGAIGIAAATLVSSLVYVVLIIGTGIRVFDVRRRDLTRGLAPALIAAGAAVLAVFAGRLVIGADSLIAVLVDGALGCIAFSLAYAFLPSTAWEREVGRAFIGRAR
ncbi:MAG TPA: oligosaccharide flippase family protein, partial [Acidimicrobiia bacterium]|nr:oligosaccharide flippase family protein [Acidimicrobiia bacterium]